MDETVSRGGRIALLALGVLFLLPGACSLVYSPLVVVLVKDFFAPYSPGHMYDSPFGAIWLVGIALGVVGLLLIWSARKSGR